MMKVMVGVEGPTAAESTFAGGSWRRSSGTRTAPCWGPLTYDVVVVGGGLAALLLLSNLGDELPSRVAVIDPAPLNQRRPVHWSYWSSKPTPYDRFALGHWVRARVADGLPQDLAPYALRLVRSTDVLAHLHESLSARPIEWVTGEALSITRCRNGSYAVETTAGRLHARWVFDSACNLPPVFPSPRQPSSAVVGSELRVVASQAAFDPFTATLFDPIDSRTFAYLLPLTPIEALLESASFGSADQAQEPGLLPRYLERRYPSVAFTITHSEPGAVPLGFPPARTTGPRHVLLGTKRGLVKPSAGYGVVRIAQESEELARRWRHHQTLRATHRSAWRWRLVDRKFLRLAARHPSGPVALLGQTMRSVPVVQALRLIDEDLPLRQLARLLQAAAPALSGHHRGTRPGALATQLLPARDEPGRDTR
jgi:lycopene beta-cyclase